jgi:hypothetical protein
MADSIFDLVADELERRTDLSKLEARGTVRLSLREAGLDARSATLEQMKVLLEKVLPKEMNTRGVEDAEQICQAIIGAVSDSGASAATPDGESPEAIFRRLAEA